MKETILDLHRHLLYGVIFLSIVILISTGIQLFHVWMDCSKRKKPES